MGRRRRWFENTRQRSKGNPREGDEVNDKWIHDKWFSLFSECGDEFVIHVFYRQGHITPTDILEAAARVLVARGYE
jgi:hypothetical protein